MIRMKIQKTEDNALNIQLVKRLKTRKNNDGIFELYKNQDDKKATETVTDPGTILSKCRDFYNDLYKESNSINQTQAQSEFLSKNLFRKKLSPEQNRELDRDLYHKEIAKAVWDQKNGISGGDDGYPIEFFKFFWPQLGDIVCESIIYTSKNHMSPDQKRTILRLIPKADKDHKYIKFHRPISLLNSMYKVYAKVISNRIEGVMNDLIDDSQNAYIKKRSIFNNLRNISDIIDFCNKTHKIAFLMFADFEKAFDSISWQFIYKIMNNFGFGEKFISFIKVAYTDLKIYVSNNGFLSDAIVPGRGLKQGCSLSCFLYLLVGEVLFRKIQLCKGIKGIAINKLNFKCSQLADDTTLFLNDEISIINSVSLFKRFEQACGLKLNADKSEVLKLGTDRKTYNPDSNYNMKWPQSPIKALGQLVVNDSAQMQKINEEECVSRVENAIGKLKGIK